MNKWIAILILACMPLVGVAQESEIAAAPAAESVEAVAGEREIEIAIEISDDEADANSRSAQAVDEVLAELNQELSDWSDEDREELKEVLQNLEQLKLIGNSWDGGGIGLGESLVAILAICLTLGMPVIIVGIVAYSSYRKKRLMHETLNQYVNSDRDIPPQVLELLTAGREPKSNLHSGLVLVGVGVGLVIFFIAVGSGAAAGIGAIPLFIGLAKLLIWKLETRSENAREV